MSESARERGFPLIDYLEMDESVEDFVNALADGFETKPDEGEASVFEMPNPIHYRSFSKGKFIFKVPESDYYFNENDCWALVKNGIARVGITDFVQQNLSDILFVDFPEVGRELAQFDDVGSVESGKSILSWFHRSAVWLQPSIQPWRKPLSLSTKALMKRAGSRR